MRELFGDLFRAHHDLNPHDLSRAAGGSETTVVRLEVDAICITTNGFVKRNGEAVMGRGCARQAAQRWPGLSRVVGSCLRQYGNHVQAVYTSEDYDVVIFPVKPVSEVCKPDKSNVVRHMRASFQPGDQVPGWACIARPELILRSVGELCLLADRNSWGNIVLPRPGCGAGELNFNQIRGILGKVLDDRFWCITFHGDSRR